MVKGIVAGDNRKPGWNEYIARDTLPMDGIFIRKTESRSQIEKELKVLIANPISNL